MSGIDDGDDLERYVRAREPVLRRTAFLLCGDWHQADDVVQAALVRVYTKWRRVQAANDRDAYVRAVLVRCWIDERRRARWRREWSVEGPVESRSAAPPADDGLADRVELLRLLGAMPPRQRACLVLRYWEDRSVEQTAELLACTPATVRSQTSRALRRMRGLLAPVPANDDKEWL